MGGEVLERKWIDNLKAPKGLAVGDGHLFIADLE